ncbi:MAG: glyoxylate/hydroxypyruvate reductase A [Oceanospirillaceae bacterium]
MQPIVFINNISIEEQQNWLAQFKLLLPNEVILLPEQINQAQAEKVQIAIAANPDAKVIARFPNLVWVQSLWAGVEALVAAVKQLQAENMLPSLQLVRLVDPQLAQTMAEAVLTWTLYLHRQIPEYIAQQRQKKWLQLDQPKAQDTRVSVLGSGELGVNAMQVLAHHGYRVSGWSRTAKNIPQVTHYQGSSALPEMLAQTDILICLLPLTEQTTGLINRALLQHLPKGAKLINFGRGGIVNHQDLIECLDEEQIGHAVLDVFEQEPLSASSPLWEHQKISVLPHISAMTNLATASKVAADNISAYRTSGNIPVSVDLKRGY